MVLIYLTVGFIIMFINSILPNLEDTYKKLFGILIIVYAFYRIYRVYTYFAEVKENNSGFNNDEKN